MCSKAFKRGWTLSQEKHCCSGSLPVSPRLSNMLQAQVTSQYSVCGTHRFRVLDYMPACMRYNVNYTASCCYLKISKDHFCFKYAFKIRRLYHHACIRYTLVLKMFSDSSIQTGHLGKCTGVLLKPQKDKLCMTKPSHVLLFFSFQTSKPVKVA